MAKQAIPPRQHAIKPKKLHSVSEGSQIVGALTVPIAIVSRVVPVSVYIERRVLASTHRERKVRLLLCALPLVSQRNVSADAAPRAAKHVAR